MKTKNIRRTVTMAVAIITVFALTSFVSAASVGDAVVSTWNSAAVEIRKVVDGVVVPVLSVICGIGFVACLVLVGYDYKKHKEINWVPSILFGIGLIVALVAPPLIWSIAGLK